MILVCYVISPDHWRIMTLVELPRGNSHPSRFGSCRHLDSGDMMV